jgi:hypothetical protein
MYKEGNNCKIVYNHIRDTVAPFLATVAVGLYGYKPTIVSGDTWLLVSRPPKLVLISQSLGSE